MNSLGDVFLTFGVIMQFKSFKDFAYQHAVTTDTSRDQAQYAIDNISGFPETLPEEIQVEMVEGYRLRHSEIKKPVVYAIVNDHYVIASPEHLASKKVEKIEVSVAYVFSYSSQEFGKLKNTNPALHKIVGDARDATSTYCSNKIRELKRIAKSILTVNQGGTRESFNFVESMSKDFEKQEKSCKVKQTRGNDSTADSAKFKLAVKAFWVTYNK
jgi:hypothetical protein